MIKAYTQGRGTLGKLSPKISILNRRSCLDMLTYGGVGCLQQQQDVFLPIVNV